MKTANTKPQLEKPLASELRPFTASTTAALVDALNTSEFGAVLDAEFHKCIRFQMSAALLFRRACRTLLLHDGFEGLVPRETINNYLNGTFMLDAIYTACMNGIKSGLYRMEELTTENMLDNEYAGSPVFHPCVSLQSHSLEEEIVIVSFVQNDTYITYSLMRTNGEKRFSDAEFDKVALYAPAIVSLMKKNWMGTIESAPKHLRHHDQRFDDAVSEFSPRSTLHPRKRNCATAPSREIGVLHCHKTAYRS